MSSSASLPASDNGLLAWAAHFASVLADSGTSVYGLTAAQINAFNTVNLNYGDALAACDKTVRTPSAVTAKNIARAALVNEIKLLTNAVNSVATITNAEKQALGLSIRKRPTPVPVPTQVPQIEIAYRQGTTINLSIHGDDAKRRGRPAGTSGVSVFSFVGTTPSNDPAAWRYEGQFSKMDVPITFPMNTPPGTTVWFTAYFYNAKGQSGTGCSPVSAIIAGGGMAKAA